MTQFALSVVIATRNRPLKLAETLTCLRAQSVSADRYEVLVVDDGSTPPVDLSLPETCPAYRVLRLDGQGRSAARNAGAAAARGDLLVFVDDDIVVTPSFLAVHLAGQGRWPGALAVGRLDLPPSVGETPFGRFRQRLERTGIPSRDGPVDAPNFCAAGNMSVPRQRFEALGGFDLSLASGEDQDLALRHTARDGAIVYLGAAAGVHHDDALDLRSYCQRAEWGSQHIVAFCRKHPHWTDNVHRERVNGPVRLGAEPWAASLTKLVKSALSTSPSLEALFTLAPVIERSGSEACGTRFYRMMLGLHMFRGYRRGLAAAPTNSAGPKPGSR